jgi:hypothetical protein
MAEEKVPYPLFKWQGEQIYIHLFPEDVEEADRLHKENPTEFYNAVAQLLKIQRPDIFSVKPPDDAEYGLAERTEARQQLGYEAASAGSLEQWMWARRYPKAKEFFTSMSRYGGIQGATFNLADNWRLQGSDVPYRIFQHLYPGQALASEVAGALLLGGPIAGGRKLLARYAPSLFGSFGTKIGARTRLEKGLHYGKETAFGMGLGATGMGTYRYGALPIETQEKFKTAFQSQDVLIGTAVGGLAPLIVRVVAGAPGAIPALKNWLKRGTPEREAVTAQRDIGRAIAESLPALQEKGISMDDVFEGLMAAARNPEMLPTEVLLLTNLAKRLQAEGKPFKYSRLASLDRELARALKSDPDMADLVIDDLASRALSQSSRIMDDLFNIAGQPRAFAGYNLLDAQKELRKIWKPAYDRAMAEKLVIGRGVRATGSLSGTLKGQYDSIFNALRNKDNTILRDAWDRARKSIKVTLSNEGAKARVLEKHGRIPDELPSVRELLKNRYIRKQRDAEKLLAMKGPDGKPLYKKLKTRHDPDNPKNPDWILKKMDNRIDVQQAQFVERELYFLKGSDEVKRNPSLTEAVQGMIDDWNGVMNSQSPAYNTARMAYHESELLDAAYKSGKQFKLGSSTEAGESFLKFVEDQLDMYNREYVQANPEVMKKIRQMYVSSALQNITDTMDPVALLNSPESMQRLRYLLTNADDTPATSDALLSRVRTNLSTELAKAGTLTRVPTSAGLTPSAAERIGAVSLGEQVVPTLAMTMFAPFFAAGRKSAEMLRWLRGLSNTQIGRQKLRHMMSLDPMADDKFIPRAIGYAEEYAKYNPKVNYPGMRAMRGASNPILMEGGGEEFMMPERRKYSLGLLDPYNPF